MKCINKLAGLAMAVIMMLSSVCFAVEAQAAEVIPVYLNGQLLEYPANDAQPQIYQNRTYVPIRKTAEYLGLSINWNSKTETLTFSREGLTIDHTMRSNIVYVSGKAITFDTRSINVQNRTLMPIRMLGESIGGTVEWDNAQRAVYITTNNAPAITETTTSAPVAAAAAPQIVSATLSKNEINIGSNVKVAVKAKDATKIKLVDAATQNEIETITEYGEEDGSRLFEALIKGENDTKETIYKSIIVIAGNDTKFYDELSNTKLLTYAVTTNKSDKDDDDDSNDSNETIKSDYLVSYKFDKTKYAVDDYAYLTIVTKKDISKVRVTNNYNDSRTESSDYSEKGNQRTFEVKHRLSEKGTVYLYITLYVEDEGYESVKQRVSVDVGKTSSSKTYDELEIVDIDVLNDTVYIDEDAHLLVYTSTDVAEVSVYNDNDKKVGSSYYYYAKEDGQLVWKLKFPVEYSGRNKYTVFAYNNNDDKVSESIKIEGEKYSSGDCIVLGVDQVTSNVRNGDTCKFEVKCTGEVSWIMLANHRGSEISTSYSSNKNSSKRIFTISGDIDDIDDDYYIYGYDDKDNKQSSYKFRVVGSSSSKLEFLDVDVQTSRVYIDDEVELTVETSNNVTRMVIEDQSGNRLYKKAKPTKEKDDYYVWEVSFSPEEKGRNTFTITIEDEDDNTKEWDFNVTVTK